MSMQHAACADMQHAVMQFVDLKVIVVVTVTVTVTVVVVVD